ncbi:MAG: hypothetical protein HY756_06120 [Nitrospirae bacterium]|nr:hypothetical protein [Nitrospirota bacterium]
MNKLIQLSTDFKFVNIVAEAMRTLTPLHREIYRLYLLGWSDWEIAASIMISPRPQRVCTLLYDAKTQVKEFIRKKYGFVEERIHEELKKMLRDDMDKWERIQREFIPNEELLKSLKQEVEEVHLKFNLVDIESLQRISMLKERCIEELTIASDWMSSEEWLKRSQHQLKPEERKEFLEQLEIWEAATEGHECLVTTQINLVALRNRILSLLPFNQEHPAPEKPVIGLSWDMILIEVIEIYNWCKEFAKQVANKVQVAYRSREGLALAKEPAQEHEGQTKDGSLRWYIVEEDSGDLVVRFASHHMELEGVKFQLKAGNFNKTVILEQVMKDQIGAEVIFPCKERMEMPQDAQLSIEILN